MQNAKACSYHVLEKFKLPKQQNIPIISAEEPWCKVELANGAILAHRIIIKGAHQIMNNDGSPLLQENGDVVIGLDTQLVVTMQRAPVDKKDMN